MMNSGTSLKRFIGIYECRRCKRVSYSKETEVENYRGWIFELFPIYSSHICNDLDPDTQGLTELVGVREVPTEKGEAESHIALVERLNKQVEELQKQVAHWQGELAKSMCEVTLRELEKPRWIPVTERFPEMHEEVLVCNEDYGKTWLGFLEVAVWDGSDWICTWDMESRLHCITRWMTLPKPPKEERKDADS